MLTVFAAILAVFVLSAIATLILTVLGFDAYEDLTAKIPFYAMLGSLGALAIFLAIGLLIAALYYTS